MIALKLMAMILVNGPEVLPDCQRFCLGVCHYDRAKRRCEDSRVQVIGTWDPVPVGYAPAKLYDFPVNKLGTPPVHGYFDAERPSNRNFSVVKGR